MKDFRHPCKSTPSGVAFTNNPIAVNYGAEEGGSNSPAALRYAVEFCGGRIFEGRFSGNLSVDLSPIAKATTPYIPEINENDYKSGLFHSIIDDLENFSMLRIYDLSRPEFDLPIYSVYTLQGGIPAGSLRKVSKGNDAFTLRFHERSCNCFFTDRGNQREISIKETELSPLYLIIWEESVSVFCRPSGSTAKEGIGVLNQGIWALDINEMRKYMFGAYGIIHNRFEIFFGDKKSCTIVITKAAISEDRYRLKFRNRYGVFEIMELCGSLTAKYTEADDEDTFEVYDTASGIMTEDYTLKSKQVEITAQTGYKSPEEYKLICQLLRSDEVWLLDAFGQPIKVLPSIAELVLKYRPDEPVDFNLTLRCVDKDPLADLTDEGWVQDYKPGMFSRQFSKEFK